MRSLSSPSETATSACVSASDQRPTWYSASASAPNAFGRLRSLAPSRDHLITADRSSTAPTGSPHQDLPMPRTVKSSASNGFGRILAGDKPSKRAVASVPRPRTERPQANPSVAITFAVGDKLFAWPACRAQFTASSPFPWTAQRTASEAMTDPASPGSLPKSGCWASSRSAASPDVVGVIAKPRK